jgi:hypothetical protein
VQAHSALVRAADASELQGITFCLGCCYVFEPRGGIANDLDERAWIMFLV